MKKNKNNMKELFLGVFLFSISYILYPVSVQAARFLVETPKDSSVSPYVVNIYFEPERDSINTIEGSIELSGQFQPSEIRYGNSAILLWVEEPHYDKSVSGVVFSGIIPNGFSGDRALILSLILNSKLGISVRGAAYKNDGEGGQIILPKSSTKVIFGDPLEYQSTKFDLESPESFRPIVGKDPAFGEGKQVVFFATQDKFSGIDRYEVAEEKPVFLFFEPSNPAFTPQKSPYLLSDQNGRSLIYIKAVDKNGNERIEKISPESGPYTYRDELAWFIIGIVFLAVLRLQSRRK